MTSSRALRAFGLAALVMAGAFSVAILVVAPSDPEFAFDASAYLAAADRLREGEPLYPEFEQGVTGLNRSDWLDVTEALFLYPPPVVVWFLPLSVLPDATAELAWYGILIAVAAAVGAALVRRVPPDARPLAAAAYVSYLPLLSELRFGNLNLLTLAFVLAAWKLRHRFLLAGPLLAVAVGLKLLPLALLAFLVVARRSSMVVAAIAAGLVTVVASWPWLGSAWLDYLTTVTAIGLGAPAAGSNIVPDALAAAPGRYVLPAVAVLIALAAGVVARRDGELEDDAFRVALAAAPLLSTSVWYPYLVLALPALLLPAASGRRAAGVAAAASWTAIQARFLPVPLLGLLLLIATRMVAITRRSGTPVDHRLQREPQPKGA